ncbi:MAG: hypothetical protein GC157_05350 [Frankiales bacterium]|nr:hypothetical protein [Frankiales bacterium]
MTTTPGSELDEATRRALAVGLFNRVWELLDQPSRSADDDEELVDAAHASRYHWRSVGGARELAIGDWQLARVYAVLGRAEPALVHARRCRDRAQRLADEPWLTASAYEALARAHVVAGDRAAAAAWKARAVEQLALEPDPDNREVVERDLATLPL